VFCTFLYHRSIILKKLNYKANNNTSFRCPLRAIPYAAFTPAQLVARNKLRATRNLLRATSIKLRWCKRGIRNRLISVSFSLFVHHQMFLFITSSSFSFLIWKTKKTHTILYERNCLNFNCKSAVFLCTPVYRTTAEFWTVITTLLTCCFSA